MVMRPWRVVATMAGLLLPLAIDAQQWKAWELGVQGGAAPASREGGWFGGQVAGVTQAVVTLEASHPLLRIGPATLAYTAQFDPFVRLGDVEQYRVVGGASSPIVVVGDGGRAWGAALVPFALRFDAVAARRVRLRVGSGLGIATFAQRVPTAAGRHRNFIAQVETGLDLRVGDRAWITTGIRWRHVSNGYTGSENPGIDSRLVLVGLAITPPSR